MTRRKATSTRTPSRLPKAKLTAMIAEATVDAYDETEQGMGWFSMLEEHLQLPFETTVLGVTATVAHVELRDGGRLVAICTRGRTRQAIAPEDLPLPTPHPAGGEWVEAYRCWLNGT